MRHSPFRAASVGMLPSPTHLIQCIFSFFVLTGSQAATMSGGDYCFDSNRAPFFCITTVDEFSGKLPFMSLASNNLLNVIDTSFSVGAIYAEAAPIIVINGALMVSPSSGGGAGYILSNGNVVLAIGARVETTAFFSLGSSAEPPNFQAVDRPYIEFAFVVVSRERIGLDFGSRCAPAAPLCSLIESFAPFTDAPVLRPATVL